MTAPSEPRRPQETATEQAPSRSSGADETFPAPPSQPEPREVTFGPPIQPGEAGTLGPYRIIKELGHGGMGAVYAAIDTRLERQLALKVMLPKYAADNGSRERFLREARAAAKVNHDNVVTVYEADERDGVPYIAMQFLQGYSLDAYLKKKGNPSIPQVLRIARETASGLAAAHKTGLVHRDIKPGNLWLEAPNGRVKVLDFGLARPVDAEVELTKSGAVVGTPAYMSPEQGRGEKVDRRSDLFSLGGVLYRLCTGRLPFQGSTTMAVLTALAVDEPKPVRELNPAVPESLEELIHQLLAKKVDARPQSADEVVARVRAIAEEMTTPMATAVPEQAPVIYVPIQVTAQSMDSPFAQIDESATEYEISSPRAAPVRKKPGGVMTWVFAGFAAILAGCMVIGAIVFIKNKNESDTKGDIPDDPPPNKDKSGKTLPKTVSVAGPDRRAAEYVLSMGGGVRVSGDDREIRAAAELPKGSFTIESVNFLGNQLVTDEGLAYFKECKGLTLLELYNTKVTNRGLSYFKDCKGLTYLGLTGADVSDAGMAYFKECKGLTKLLLTKTKVSDVGLACFKECKDLIQLDLDDTGTTDAGLAYFKDCKSLTRLGLGGTRVTDEGMAYFKDCKGLAVLTLQRTEVTDGGLANFKDCKELKYLYLGKVTDVGLAYFKDCKGLIEIGFRGAATDAGLAYFKDCKELKGLYVQQTKVTAKAREEFHKAVPACRIEYDGGFILGEKDPDRKAAEYVLSIGGSVDLKGDNHAITAAADLPKGGFILISVSLENNQLMTDAGMVNFKGCKGLTLLRLNGAKVTDAGLANFKDCKGLRVLFLYSNMGITDVGLENFKDCKELTTLGLGATKVTDTGLAYFKDCKGLIDLSLGADVTDKGLESLKDCKELVNLYLGKCAKVTNAGLTYFKDCKGLTTLTLDGTKVTDEGLAYFKDCKGLNTLDVRATKVTKKAVEEFHMAVPGCRIEYDDGIIEPKK